MSRLDSRAFRRRGDEAPEGSDSLWPPASPRGWLLLIGAYVVLGIAAVGCFLATFAVFSGGRFPAFVPEWLEWAAWGFAGVLATLVVAGMAFRFLRPERYEEMKTENARRRYRA